MNSLRARLTLGFALVAIVPLAASMLLLARQVRETVGRDAEARLDASLASVRAELSGQGTRLSSRLEQLAADPELRRLLLVEDETGAALGDHLAARLGLLDLDYLWVTDAAGAVMADAARSAAGARRGRAPLPAGAVAGPPRRAAAIAPLVDGAGLALDAAAPVRYRDEVVGWVRGGTVLDSAWVGALARRDGLALVLADAAGRVVASSRPGATAGPRALLSRRATLALGPPPHATLEAFASTAAADETISTLRATALLLGLLAIAVAALLGAWWSHQVSRPVEALAAFSARVARGEAAEPVRPGNVRELDALVASLERMRTDLAATRERLATGERQAAYGEMARMVAHEIKNPLTPIAISVADLKRSFDQGRPEFPEILDQAVRAIGEELESLKRLIHEFSEFGRFPPARPEPMDPRGLLEDLASLYGHEVAAGRLTVEFPAASPDRAAAGDGFRADREQLRRALVNLVQNALEAAGPAGRARVAAREDAAGVTFEVADDGPGLDDAQRERLFTPGFTTKARGSGLGLTLVERIVAEHGGRIAVESAPGRGTTFRLSLPRHPGA